MVKKAARVVMLVFIVVAVAVSHTGVVFAEPKTWTVDDDGPADFRRIQDALNAASSGDTVSVKAGIYYETLYVSKRVSLLGENKDNTIIDGNSSGTLIDVHSNNVTISGFTLRNAGKSWPEPQHSNIPDCAIWVYGYHFTNVTNNIVVSAAVGIFVGYGNNAVVQNNNVTKCEFGAIILYASTQCRACNNVVTSYKIVGIHLDHNTNSCFVASNSAVDSPEGIALDLEIGSSGNVFEENLLAHNYGGVFLYELGNNNIFRRNNLTGNRYNFGVWGFSLSSFMQEIETSNTINNKPILYLTNTHHAKITTTNLTNPGYVALVNSSDITIEGLDFSDNMNGILLAQATNCTIENLNISRNHEGMLLFNSSGNIIIGNWFDNNSVAAIVYSSNQNVFYHNSFLNNTRQILSQFLSGTDQPFGPSGPSVNKWDNGFEGNFWSDYDGVDENKNGIGDSPYVIDANNADRYPFMKPWTHPSETVVPTTLIIVAAAAITVASLSSTIYFFKIRKHQSER